MKEISFNNFFPLYKDGKIMVVDVREQDEYNQVHLEGVHHLPLSTIEERYQELEPTQDYYLICKSGIRSARAGLFLEEKGYQVTNVLGGMDALE